MAATLKKKHGYKIATATAMVARAFGIPNGTDISEVDPISAIGLGGRNVGASALMVATSLLANLVSNLAGVYNHPLFCST